MTVLTDHPHARGRQTGCMGKGGRSRTIPTHVGRTRSAPGATRRTRTIPTHVGRTREVPVGSARHADHPHARGENPTMPAANIPTDGPSPRTWGERPASRAVSFRLRTIPTHVGRTISRYPPCHPHADHPHARGENALVNVPTVNYRGPSPRTWGERDDRVTVNRRHRTIPTHVGRTAETVVVVRSRADHPHARGENRVAWLPGDYPRTIPTHVGRARPRSELRHGEHGPSPRTWGEHPT